MNDLALIYDQLKDLPDVLATRSICKHICDGPAVDRVATLQVPEDGELPGRAWQRFPCADGLLVRLPRSEQHWEQAVAEMPARARRMTVEQEVLQQVEEQEGQEQLQGQQEEHQGQGEQGQQQEQEQQQQQGLQGQQGQQAQQEQEDQEQEEQQQQQQEWQPPNSIGSVLLRALSAAACAGLLQQLTLHAPITTADVSQVLGLLPVLQHLELSRIVEQRGWDQQVEEGPWDLSAAGRGGLKHLLLQVDLQESQPVLVLLPGSGAPLQSLHLLAGVCVADGAAISSLSNLQTLEVYSNYNVRDGSLSRNVRNGGTEEQVVAVLGPLQQLQELYLPAFELCFHCDTKLGQLFAGLQHLRKLRLGYVSICNAEPKVVLPGVTELGLLGLTMGTGYSIRRSMMPDETRGWITKVLPALQVFSSSGKCNMHSSSFLAAFAGHDALRSLSATIGGYRGRVAGDAVDELASIAGLEDLELLDVSREQVLDLVQQLRACSKLQRLHLKGAHMVVSHRLDPIHLGPWRMDEEARCRLRELQAAALGAGCVVTVTGLAEMDA
jgi:hypothetical protein